MELIYQQEHPIIEMVKFNHPLFKLLAILDYHHYWYSIHRTASDSISLHVTFVGERVEVAVFDDGHMEVSRFPGSEDVVGGEELILGMVEKAAIDDARQS